ncbi:MAG: cation diffusion facilitator family transporter, partial [Gammaproteobacteria bacterium]|nr:cation diffusion facilitator family transporter [Gammaproteobacteria bacterium]
RLLKLASHASVATAGALLLMKLFAYWLTGSISIMASLLDSLLDIVASVINLLAIRVALMPPDKEHPFGHGKAEALAGLGQATFIAGSAFFLMIQAVSQLQHPEDVVAMDIGIVVMFISIIVTAVLIVFQRHVIRQTNSVAIRADSMHYMTDLLTNTMVITALVMVWWGISWMDGAMALVIGLYILYSAWQIIWESIQLLLDRELPEEIQESIRELVLSDSDIEAVHEIKTRESGHTQFIQLHLEMDGDMSLFQAHVISDRVMASLMEKFPSAEILIHQDPYNDASDQEQRIIRE